MNQSLSELNSIRNSCPSDGQKCGRKTTPNVASSINAPTFLALLLYPHITRRSSASKRNNKNSNANHLALSIPLLSLSLSPVRLNHIQLKSCLLNSRANCWCRPGLLARSFAAPAMMEHATCERGAFQKKVVFALQMLPNSNRQLEVCSEACNTLIFLVLLIHPGHVHVTQFYRMQFIDGMYTWAVTWTLLTSSEIFR